MKYSLQAAVIGVMIGAFLLGNRLNRRDSKVKNTKQSPYNHLKYRPSQVTQQRFNPEKLGGLEQVLRKPPAGVSDRPGNDRKLVQVNPYATFTERFRLFNNQDQMWVGEWTKANSQGGITNNFESDKGRAEVSFSFMPEISKTWMHLSIMDDKYLDSNKFEMSVNLKMSTYYPNNSSFHVKCNSGDEYYAYAASTESIFEKETYAYFDLDLWVTFVNSRTQSPLDFNNYNSGEVKINLRMESKELKLKTQASFHQPQNITKKSSFWRDFLLGFCVIVLFFISFCGVAELTHGFLKNMSFEVLILISLFYYHLFCLFMALAKEESEDDDKEDNTSLFYFLAGIAFCQSLITNLMGLQIFFFNLAAQNIGTGAKIYHLIAGAVFLVGSVFVAVYTRIVVSSWIHKYILLGFFFFPVLQVIITFYVASNRNLFAKGYQVFQWGFAMGFGLFLRGFENPILNLRPYPTLLYLSVPVMVASSVFMLIQSIFGLYFFLPKKLQPGYVQLIFPIETVPMEKRMEECSICYVPLFQSIDGPPQAIPNLNPEEDNSHQDIVLEHENRPPAARAPIPNDGLLEMTVHSLENQNQQAENEELVRHCTHLMKPPCGHYFHIECLEEWLKARRVCPLCNAFIPHPI